MKYYIIAGEASGDLHGSNLIKGLKLADPDASFRVWGGDLMKNQGIELVKHYKESAVMGFVEVISHLPKIFSNLNLCKRDILATKPDVVILIDYPGFNLKIAKFSKSIGVKVFYYISPKVWAWKERRIDSLKRYVDKLFVIFPFEVEYFKKHGIEVVYRGNPLMDSINNHNLASAGRDEFLKANNLENREYIALLAGSRKSEISYMMPRLLELEKRLPNYMFVLAGAPSIEAGYYNSFLKESSIKLVTGSTYEVLKHSLVAVVNSGTASLEAAIIGTPQVVCYGGNEISYQIAKRFVKVKFISLVNLILDREIVKELIQHDCTSQNIEIEVNKLLSGAHKKRQLSGYRKVINALGEDGSSEQTAKAMFNELMNFKGKIYRFTYSSPIGNLKIVCNEKAIIELTTTDEKTIYKDSHPLLEKAVIQLGEYFKKRRENFDLPLHFNGTEFQNRVWKLLSNIPYGTTKSYSEIAKVANTPNGSRAIGMACKMNPLMIFLPCHRVIGAHHEITGFNGGIEKKIYLLNLERKDEDTLF